MADSGSSSSIPKAISSLAKKPTDVTRQGTTKLKFTPVLPARRKKEEEPAPAPSPTADRARGRGRGRGRGEGSGRGRGDAPRAPPEMTASGPFALGPAMAGAGARRAAPRTAIVPGPSNTALGTSLTGPGPSKSGPFIKKEPGAPTIKTEDADDGAYSDPDDGVEIIDMEHVQRMDWMAPETIRRDRSARANKQEDEEDVLGLSAAEPIDDMSQYFGQLNADDIGAADSQERQLYLFHFPAPFPMFMGTAAQSPEPKTSPKRVSFALDTNLSQQDIPTPSTDSLDGAIGNLELYRSGAVKMRFDNGIVLDVMSGIQPTFLHYAVCLDVDGKELSVLGDINQRFVVSPDVDSLLEAMEHSDQVPPDAMDES